MPNDKGSSRAVHIQREDVKKASLLKALALRCRLDANSAHMRSHQHLSNDETKGNQLDNQIFSTAQRVESTRTKDGTRLVTRQKGVDTERPRPG